MAVPLDPTSSGFLFAENRNQPMHVGGLQLFDPPGNAGPDYVRDMFTRPLGADEVAPLFLKRPHRSLSTGGQWVWTEDDQFDIEYHVRHSASPSRAGSGSCSPCAPGCTAPGSRSSGRCGRPT